MTPQCGNLLEAPGAKNHDQLSLAIREWCWSRSTCSTNNRWTIRNRKNDEDDDDDDDDDNHNNNNNNNNNNKNKKNSNSKCPISKVIEHPPLYFSFTWHFFSVQTTSSNILTLVFWGLGGSKHCLLSDSVVGHLWGSLGKIIHLSIGKKNTTWALENKRLLFGSGNTKKLDYPCKPLAIEIIIEFCWNPPIKQPVLFTQWNIYLFLCLTSF